MQTSVESQSILPYSLSLSFGAASFQSQPGKQISPEQLLEGAGRALYHKKLGKNSPYLK